MTTGFEGIAAVRSMEGGEILQQLEQGEQLKRETCGGCFDDAGERLAYFMLGFWAGKEDPKHNGRLVICSVDNDYQELKRIRCPDLGYIVYSQFSPGDGKLILLMTHDDFTILDVSTGEQPPWSRCLRALMLPRGRIVSNTVRWVPPLQQDVNAVTLPSEPHLILQAAVGPGLYHIDVTTFIQSFEEDGNFSVEQLNRLSDINPEGIPVLLNHLPHKVNLRDKTTGDTVLHHCSQTGNSTAAQRWMDGEVPFTPLENGEGRSAVSVAAEQKLAIIAKALLTKLNPCLPLNQTQILTADLLTLAEGLASYLVEFVHVLENEQHYSLFRQQKEIKFLSRYLEDFEVRASADGSDTASWTGYCLPDIGGSIQCDCKLEVLALCGFTAAASTNEISPYGRLYRACETNGKESLKALMSTRTMVVTTRFKWQAFVKQRMVRVCGFYIVHFMLACSTFTLSTRDSSSKMPISNVLPILLLLTNTKCVYDEVRQFSVTLKYLPLTVDGIWNALDLGGIAAVYVACGAHYLQGNSFVLQQVGALAVLLNSMSLLQVLRPFKGMVSSLPHHVQCHDQILSAQCCLCFSSLTMADSVSLQGLLVEIITAIICDLKYFYVVIGILLLGFSVAFTVSMPNNTACDKGDNTACDKGDNDGNGQLGSAFLSSYLSMLGAFDVTDYTNAESLIFFVIFLFLVLIVMLNLLIAIMSDTYERIMESWEFEGIRMQAETIIEQEQLMSTSDKSNPEYFPKYLQVLRRVQSPPAAWAGVSGQIEKSRVSVEEEVASVKCQVKRVEEKVEAMAEAQQKELMELKVMIKMLLQQPR